jgi:hypothetical protein
MSRPFKSKRIDELEALVAEWRDELARLQELLKELQFRSSNGPPLCEKRSIIARILRK